MKIQLDIDKETNKELKILKAELEFKSLQDLIKYIIKSYIAKSNLKTERRRK